MFFKKSIFLCLVPLSIFANKRPEVDTPLGKIRGSHGISYNGRIFSSFEGIPFASPPVGELRFEKPEEIKPWSGTWEATRLFECAQNSNQKFIGSEDCLYINVYVSKRYPNVADNLNVFVHIHGGAFMVGSGHRHTKPTFFMNRDVILVTFNYRLGIFGFLSTNDDVVPGNNGLKDQNLALKWIQKNIKSFGGNPNSVTLTGLSAGAASVHFHYFSPLSKGLFHRGAVQSGVVLNPWALQEDALEKARKLGSFLGCNQTKTKNLIDCLKQRPAKAIAETTQYFYEFVNKFPMCPFAPVIEKTKSGFLTENPYKLLKSGVVNNAPLIISVTSEEGIYVTKSIESVLQEINKNWTTLATHLLDYNYVVPDSQKSVIAEKIRQYYFDEDMLENNLKNLTKLFSDRHITVGAETTAKLQSKIGDIYFYYFSYRGERSRIDLYTNENLNNSNSGVSHADDSIYLYDPFNLKQLSDEDELMKEILINMYTSYAKTNKPEIAGLNWEPISDTFSYLEIKSPKEMYVKKGNVLSATVADFWDSLLYEEHGIVDLVKDEL